MKLHFCPTCDNMLYMRNDVQRVELHCRHCQFARDMTGEEMREPVLASAAAAVTQAGEDVAAQQFCNPNIKHDCTLPRVRGVKCPFSSACEGGEVIVSRYDNAQLKYVFFCCCCERFWHAKNSNVDT